MEDTHTGREDALIECLGRRRAGVLLHITSLPGMGEAGDLGRNARDFVDFMCEAGLSVWQVLPVGPTQMEGSPYQTRSVHAGDPRLISLEPLLEAGWLDPVPAEGEPLPNEAKTLGLGQAWFGFRARAGAGDRAELDRFVSEHGFWLDDYALFEALHRECHCSWWEWPAPLRMRDPQALAEARARLASRIDYIKFEQFLFFRQWIALKEYASSRDVHLFGDVPIFVAHDSAEVWANPDLFILDDQGIPELVAGVPPDYFSETGQRWGNPLYRWERMEAQQFRFWVNRMRTQLELFDLVRIDHFRGFEAFWAIPAAEDNAVNGQWIKAPGEALFSSLHEQLGRLPLVAEDLGIITPEVDALRRDNGLPGMKVLQFAFSGGPENPYLPFNHCRNSVVYTGTHDNDTTLGWYQALDPGERETIDDYLGYSRELMPWPLIRSALASRAGLAVVPMQDILSLGSEHRMNRPGSTEGNWRWRFRWNQVSEGLAGRLRHCVELYGRA